VLAELWWAAVSSVGAHPFPLLKDRRVLDLGAGLGLNAMCFAQLGVKEVIATDMEPAFSCLQASIARNMGVLPPGKVRCEELRWGAESFTQLDALGQFDIVVCADLLYDSDLHVPLLETLLHVARDASTVIVISYEQRGSGAEV